MSNETIKIAYENAFNAELEKISKIRVGDIEDSIGGYLSDDLEDKARDLIASETANRFALRHPILSTIASAGIWPAVSKGNAIDQITKSMARKYPAVREMKAESEDKAYRNIIEQKNLNIESDKANQLSNTATSAGLAALPLITMLMQSKNKQKEEED